MIKPRPYTCNCPNCGWSKVIAPKSDCLGPGDVVRQCPKCGHAELTRKPASMLEIMLARLKSCFSQNPQGDDRGPLPRR
jgi:predicted RNA-binding Zn-ribbon protein involved in translation (DUF1610 family)